MIERHEIGVKVFYTLRKIDGNIKENDALCFICCPAEGDTTLLCCLLQELNQKIHQYPKGETL